MVKGKTPRHSKPSTPVTIDLEADKVEKADTAEEIGRADSAAAEAVEQRSKKPPTTEEVLSDSFDTGTTAETAPAEERERAYTPAGDEAIANDGAETEKEPDSATDAFSADDGAEANASEKPGYEEPADNSFAAAGPGADQPAMGETPGPENPELENEFAATGPAPRNASRGSGLLAGLAGAVIALLVFIGAQYAGLLPSRDDNALDPELQDRMSQLQATVQQLSDRVAQTQAAPGALDLSGVNSRLEALEADGSTQFQDQLRGLSEQVDALAARAQQGNGQAAQEALSALQGQTDQISASLSELQGRTEELSSQVAALTEKQAALGERLGKAEETLSGPGRDLRMARAIAVTGLKSAIDRGGAFASELDALASVSPDDPSIARLRDYAADGVPTQAQLLERFPAAANSMIAAMDPVPANAGVFDRLVESAKSMVTVRKVGDVEGEGVEAIAARLENNLKNGNLEGAMTEWNALPDQAKEAAEDFGNDLKARAEVEELLQAVQIPDAGTGAAASGNTAPAGQGAPAAEGASQGDTPEASPAEARPGGAAEAEPSSGDPAPAAAAEGTDADQPVQTPDQAQ